MSTTVRRGVIAMGLATLAIVGADAIVMPAVSDTRSACQRTSAWVHENAGNLPHTLATLATYPVEYRRAIFAALPPDVRSALYREQYRQFAASHSLTDQQQQTVALAAALASPAFYAANGQHNEQTLAAYAALARQIAAAFSPDDRKVFYQLGPDVPVGLTLRGVVLRLRAAARSVLVAHAGFQCDCNYDAQSGCASGSYCAHTEPACDPRSGCGPNGGVTCDGLCWKPEL